MSQIKKENKENISLSHVNQLLKKHSNHIENVGKDVVGKFKEEKLKWSKIAPSN